jgi:hypothetical protein
VAKRKNTQKPRTYTVTLDMGKPVIANAVFFDPNKGFTLLNNGRALRPQKAIVEQTYERKKRPKVLNRVETHPNILFANPNRILEQFDIIYAVDTNTRVINSTKISVSGVVGGGKSRIVVEKHTVIRYRPIKCLEFHNVSCKEENLGWKEVIKAICRDQNYNDNKRIALIVDSDLGEIDSYNEKSRPIIESFYLPSNFTLVYASTDSGSENIANKMLKLSDSISSVILQGIEQENPKDGLVKIENEPYTHIRVWEPRV